MYLTPLILRGQHPEAQENIGTDVAGNYPLSQKQATVGRFAPALNLRIANKVHRIFAIFTCNVPGVLLEKYSQ